jgi:hypothetical protein
VTFGGREDSEDPGLSLDGSVPPLPPPKKAKYLDLEDFEPVEDATDGLLSSEGK